MEKECGAIYGSKATYEVGLFIFQKSLWTPLGAYQQDFVFLILVSIGIFFNLVNRILPFQSFVEKFYL